MRGYNLAKTPSESDRFPRRGDSSNAEGVPLMHHYSTRPNNLRLQNATFTISFLIDSSSYGRGTFD